MKNGGDCQQEESWPCQGLWGEGRDWLLEPGGSHSCRGGTAVGKAHLNGGCGFSKDRTVSASCGLEGRELVKQIPGPCSPTVFQSLPC